MNRRTWTRLMSLAGAAALVAAVGATAMATPSTISYIGELHAENGLPYNGAVEVIATLFDAATAGNIVRAPENLGMVWATDGRLEFQIGKSGGPIEDALLANEAIWLELSIDGITLEGRQRLQSAPYALQADDATHLGAAPAANFVTQSELGAHIAAAASAATAPMDPTPGTLWWDEPNDNLYIWDSGVMDWVAVSSSDVTPENLPGNGLGAASNGMLSNEFEGVQHQWTTGADIQDATIAGDGAPATAIQTVVEGAQSYIYNIQIDTNFSLSSSNSVVMTLYPPGTTDVGAIELSSGTLTFGPYGQQWTTTTTPALSALLGTSPAGDWTLAIVDKDNNLDDSTPMSNSAGTLHSFTVSYDVVRSDNLAGHGTLEIENLEINNSLSGTNLTTNSMESDGDLDVTGYRARKLQYQSWRDAQPDSGGLVAGRIMTFTKHRDDTWLRIEWNDVTNMSTTSNRYYDIRIGAPGGTKENCQTPYIMRFYQDSNGWYQKSTRHWVGYCQKLSNIDGVPEVNGGVNIPAGEYELQIYQNSSSMQIGWNDAFGSISVEELNVQQ